jgi:hypothetical protein
MGVKVRRGQRGSRRRAGSEFTQKMGVAAKARGGQGSLEGWGSRRGERSGFTRRMGS